MTFISINLCHLNIPQQSNKLTNVVLILTYDFVNGTFKIIWNFIIPDPIQFRFFDRKDNKKNKDNISYSKI